MNFIKLSVLILVLGTTGMAPLSAQGKVTVKGYGVEGIDFKPLPAIFAVAVRGELEEVSIEFTNRRPEPLEIIAVENHPSDRFTARVETLEEGRRFRVTVALKGEGPVGKQQDVLKLKTNLADMPILRIPVNTRVREKVYTFPEEVFMGRFPLREIRGNPDSARSLAQTLMVYRKGTTGFEIKASSDIPFLKIESEQGPKGDRWENTIYYDAEKATAGQVRGKIFIETNDPDVPKLEVPVWGDLQSK